MSKSLTEKLSLQEVLKEFLFDCKLRKLSERTTKSYKNNNLSFFRYIETEYELIEVCEVSHKVIQTVETVERIILECGSACNVREEIRISPHTARHYYAQTQLKNGCDLYTLSRLLGHSKIDVTKIYLQSMESETTGEIGCRTSPLNALAI